MTQDSNTKRNSAVARGAAAFMGLFSLLNVLAGLVHPGFDANYWWINLHLPAGASQVALGLAGAVLLAWAIAPKFRPVGLACFLLSAALLGISVVNAAEFFLMLRAKEISSGFPLPFSLLVAAGMAAVLVGLWRYDGGRLGRWGWAKLLATMGVLAVVFPLGQIFCFGKTDYRRPADAAVVFGARVYADGKCSDAVRDRVYTAAKLYHDGLARKLIMSGGPGDGPTSEPQAMRDLAVHLGVPPEDIILDESGLNTRQTVENTSAIFARLDAHRVLAVSHFYHMPRVKLTYQRQGVAIYTVPAEEVCPLQALPFLIAREVAALWAYYLMLPTS